MFKIMGEEESIIKYLKKIVSKSRKRNLLDQRNYLIGILYHKYGYTEKEIAIVAKRDRSSLTQSKNSGWYLKNDTDFNNNIKEIKKLFPFEFSKPLIQQVRPVRKVIIHVALSPEIQILLDNYQIKIGTFRKSSAITHFLNNHLEDILNNYEK